MNAKMVDDKTASREERNGKFCDFEQKRRVKWTGKKSNVISAKTTKL